MSEAKLVIPRGLPRCGKTSRCLEWVEEDPRNRVRVNRDELRAMAHNGKFLLPTDDGQPSTERAIRAARLALIRELLDRGYQVVADDTNLTDRDFRELRLIAETRGVEAEVWDMSDVPLQVCIERDRRCRDQGQRYVGQSGIRAMYEQFVKGQPYPLPTDEPSLFQLPAHMELYVPPPAAPSAVLCDMDGTLALIGNRDPFDMTRVGEDTPNLPVVQTVRALAAQGHRILITSARMDVARGPTFSWLDRHVSVPVEKLLMRKDGDFRSDAEVKLEMFDQEIRYQYRVLLALDDRGAPVRLWRALGLTCLQAATGDF